MACLCIKHLLQPDYEPVYPYLSDYIIGLLYENMSADIFVNLDDLGIMSPINEKLQDYQSSKLHTMQAEIAFKKGLFSQMFNTQTGRGKQVRNQVGARVPADNSG
ncbi:hypothetical protein FACS189416_3920 [Bacteroidia bacterium]|nr:hypothetical protein FACS189416_3920 [Bacteroidia bacterium]